MTQAHSESGPRAGQVIGDKWRLIRRIGEGGMGDVYEAQHSFIGRRFAIKFLHPFLAQNPEAMTRFQHEAQAAGGIEHENIGAALDFGTADDGAPYLVMEYLDGENLARLLVRTGPLAIPRAAYIIIQACRGLAAAHARGIVHRDLKPENLFICKRVDGSDLVKVVDFGIAKLRTQVTVTRSGMTMGTPCYMSLEQARGAKDVDHRTDIYALGVILYEAISGAKPYPGETYNEVLYNLFTSEVTPLDTLRPGLDAGLSEIVHRAIAREAGARFGSVHELADALVPYAGRPVTPIGSQVGLVARSPADVSEGVATPSPVVQPTLVQTALDITPSPVVQPTLVQTALDITPAPVRVSVAPPKHEGAGSDAVIRGSVPGRRRRWLVAAAVAVTLAGPLTYGAGLLLRGRQPAAAASGGELPAAGERGRPPAGSSQADPASTLVAPPSSPSSAAGTPAVASPPSPPPASGTGESPAASPTERWPAARSQQDGGRRRRTEVGASDASENPARARRAATRPTAAGPAKPEAPSAAAKIESEPAASKKRVRSFDPYPED